MLGLVPKHLFLSTLIGFWLLGFTQPTYGQEAWTAPRLLFWYSDNLNPNTGGDNLLSAHYAIGRLEDRYLQPSPWNEEGWLGKTGAVGYRLLKINFVDFPLLTFFTAIPQHEIFGHGYRAREFNFKDIRYEFSPPWPYGKGAGLTSFNYPRLGRTPDQELAISTGGVEATGIMAGKLRQYWFLAGTMDYHGALLYSATAGDLRNYLSQTDEKTLDSDPDLSNDMLNYIKVLNAKVDRTQSKNFKLHLDRIEKNSRITLIDPFLWYSFWTVLKTHLWSGESVFAFPSIPLGSMRYLPLLGYGLTPWGPEYQIENILALEKRVFTWRLRIGDDTFRKSWGSDLNAINLLSVSGFDLDLGLHIWNQPRLRLDIQDLKTIPLFYGGAGTLDLFSPDLGLAFPLRLAGGLDYKSSGFLPGANLDDGLTWRFGLDIPL